MGGPRAVMRGMKIDQRYLFSDVDRHGKRRWYARFRKRKVRLRHKPGSADFAAELATAIKALQDRFGYRPPITEKQPHAKGTFGWLGARYFASVEFQSLAPQSQRTRRNVLESCFAEPLSETDQEPMGNCPLPHLSALKVKRLRDLKGDKKGAANNRKKYISSMFSWAVEAGEANSNPARDVRRAHYATDGFHAWTETELEQYEARHPIGTKARLALGLLLFLGMRKSDMVGLGRQHIVGSIRGGTIRYTPLKTSYKRLEPSFKPILSELADVLEGSPLGPMTFLVTEYGAPFSGKGFGSKMRQWCDEAGLPECTSHGLKKLGAIRAAEGGASAAQMMAVFDWKSIKVAQVYIDRANRKKMAGEVMPLIAKRGKAEQE